MESKRRQIWVPEDVHQRLAARAGWNQSLWSIIQDLLDHIDQCPLAAVGENSGEVSDEAKKHSSRHHQRELARV